MKEFVKRLLRKATPPFGRMRALELMTDEQLIMHALAFLINTDHPMLSRELLRRSKPPLPEAPTEMATP